MGIIKLNIKTYSKVTGAVLDSGTLKELKAKNGMYYSVGTGITYKGFVVGLA